MRVIIFVIALGLVVLSLWLMGLAFSNPEFGGVIFFSAIISFSLALAVPFHLMRG